MQLTPSMTTTMTIDGGGQVTGDTLVLDAGGRSVRVFPGSSSWLVVAGLKPVHYQAIQDLQFINRLYLLYLALIQK